MAHVNDISKILTLIRSMSMTKLPDGKPRISDTEFKTILPTYKKLNNFLKRHKAQFNKK